MLAVCVGIIIQSSIINLEPFSHIISVYGGSGTTSPNKLNNCVLEISADKNFLLPPLVPQKQTYQPILIVSDNISGIPVVEYGYIHGVYIGTQRNPDTISHFAIDDYNGYKQKGCDFFKKFSLNNSNWLVNHASNRGNYSLLEYNFPWPDYNLSSPWHSGLAQAQAIVAMIKAHELTGDKKYLDTAKMLLNSFYVDVKDGGVTYKTPKNGWWYEEFAGKGGKEPHVLNGMMSTLIGIYSYYKYTNDTAAKYLFDQGILALKKNIPLYNVPGYNYSYYDILGTTNPLSYHKLQIELLSRLYNITNDEVFRQYYNMWINYKAPPYIHQKLDSIPQTKIYS